VVEEGHLHGRNRARLQLPLRVLHGQFLAPERRLGN
jgi:hypothetical protein